MVEYLDPNRQDYVPLIKTSKGEILQLFTIIRNDDSKEFLAVDHKEFPSATAYLAHLKRAGVDVGDFKYIRTATNSELREYIGSKQED